MNTVLWNICGFLVCVLVLFFLSAMVYGAIRDIVRKVRPPPPDIGELIMEYLCGCGDARYFGRGTAEIAHAIGKSETECEKELQALLDRPPLAELKRLSSHLGGRKLELCGVLRFHNGRWYQGQTSPYTSGRLT